MTTAEAILSILGPVGVFLSTIATLAVKRHFRFIDRLEDRIGKHLEASAKTQAEMVEEMRLSRLDREAKDSELRQIVGEVEAELGRKIEDRRYSDLRTALEELRGKKAKSDPPTPAEQAAPEVTPAKDERPDPIERALEAEPRPRRQRTNPRLEAVPAAVAEPRPSLRSASGR